MRRPAARAILHGLIPVPKSTVVDSSVSRRAAGRTWSATSLDCRKYRRTVFRATPGRGQSPCCRRRKPTTMVPH